MVPHHSTYCTRMYGSFFSEFFWNFFWNYICTNFHFTKMGRVTSIKNVIPKGVPKSSKKKFRKIVQGLSSRRIWIVPWVLPSQGYTRVVRHCQITFMDTNPQLSLSILTLFCVLSILGIDTHLGEVLSKSLHYYLPFGGKKSYYEPSPVTSERI
jgi:hypothetical protein